jgi:hypothetical protein
MKIYQVLVVIVAWETAKWIVKSIWYKLHNKN